MPAIHMLCAGLYRGLGVTVIRDTPSYGVYFCIYEGGKEVLEPGSRQNGCRNPLTLFVSGSHGCALCIWLQAI